MLRHGKEVDWKVGHTPAVQYPPPPQRSRQRAASTSQAQAPETLRMVHHANHQTKAEPSPPPPPLKRKRRESGAQSSTRRRKASVDVTATQHFPTAYGPPPDVYLPAHSQVERIVGTGHRLLDEQVDEVMEFARRSMPYDYPPHRRRTPTRMMSGGERLLELHSPPMSSLEPPPPPPSSSSRQTPPATFLYHHDRPPIYHREPEPLLQSSAEREHRLQQQQRALPHQPRPSYPVFPPEPEAESSQPAASSKPSHQRSQSFPHPRSTTATSSNASANGNTNMASTSRADASSSDLPPLSLSILGVEPLDEFIKEIADFVHHMIVTRPEHLGGLVEVEAKVGVLREPRSGARIHVPVLVESVLQPDALDVRFESNMSVTQHRHYNQLLNNLKTSSDSPSHPASPVEYSHLYLIDTFYADTSNDLTNGDRRLRGGDKIRVTRDEKTNSVVQCVKKIRLGDLNIYSPKRSADWRISVNLEVPCPHPIGSATHSRKKDRLRYSHEEFMIDLTQVVSHTSPGAPPQTSHELELEVSRPELLLATAAKRNDLNYSEHERSAFDELIRAFVNNARILVRNSIPFDIPQ